LSKKEEKREERNPFGSPVCVRRSNGVTSNGQSD